MIRVIRLAVPLVAVVAACSRPPVARDTQSDTYAVYAAALDSFAVPRDKPLRIASHAWPYQLAPTLDDTSAPYRGVEADAGIGSALLSAYDRVNEGSSRLNGARSGAGASGC